MNNAMMVCSVTALNGAIRALVQDIVRPESQHVMKIVTRKQIPVSISVPPTAQLVLPVRSAAMVVATLITIYATMNLGVQAVTACKIR